MKGVKKMDMFFVWLGFILVAGGFVHIGIWQKQEPKRFSEYIKKERRFIAKMIHFDDLDKK
jgi:hypothetical protein